MTLTPPSHSYDEKSPTPPPHTERTNGWTLVELSESVWHGQAILESTAQRLAQQLADALIDSGVTGLTAYLHGDLGAGKTAWVRWLLRSLGVDEPIRSPTFALAQSYVMGPAAQRLSHVSVWHLDLYRLSSAQELRDAGLQELFDGQHWVWVEWPERAANTLPEADLHLLMAFGQDEPSPTRSVRIEAHSERGRLVLQHWVPHQSMLKQPMSQGNKLPC